VNYYWLNDGGEVEDPDHAELTCHYKPGELVAPEIEDELMESIPGPPVLVKEASGGFDAEYEDGGETRRLGACQLYLNALQWDEGRGVYVATYHEKGRVGDTGEFLVLPPARKRQN